MSESTSSASKESFAARLKRDGPTITFLMGLGRGLSAIAVGLLLLFIPDKSASMAANKMGFFWLFSGIALLKLNSNDPTLATIGKKTSMVIAVVGIIAGLLMVTRRLTEQIVPVGVIATLLGVVIMLTGLIHLWSEFQVGDAASHGHRALHALLGVFEVILGLTLILSPLDQGQFTYWIATVWALLFGFLAIGEAIVQWMHERKTP